MLLRYAGRLPEGLNSETYFVEFQSSSTSFQVGIKPDFQTSTSSAELCDLSFHSAFLLTGFQIYFQAKLFAFQPVVLRSWVFQHRENITGFAVKAYRYPYCQLLRLNWKYFFIVHLINLHFTLVWKVASSLPLLRILMRLATVNASRLSNQRSKRTQRVECWPQAGWQTHAGWSAHWKREEVEKGERTHMYCHFPITAVWSHLKYVKRQNPSHCIP